MRNNSVKVLENAINPLLAWYGNHARDLPWRKDPTPYKVWVSEIMLQQTRVEAGKEYFNRWMEALPHVEALANVPDERLMKLWEGLGYYNRARNLKKAAGILMEKYSGILPASYDELLSLPGIGPYTAGAVASIAYKIPVPAVDGNVLRVISRLLESDGNIALATTKKAIEQMLGGIIPDESPGDFNQALMELGALICIPNGAPKCTECPLLNLCKAHASGTENSLPIKTSKKPRMIQEKTVLLILREGEYLLHRRDQKGLLAGMWEFPNTEGRLSCEEAEEMVKDLGFVPLSVRHMPESKHIFSHVEWHMFAYLIEAQAAGAKTISQDSICGADRRIDGGADCPDKVSEETRLYIRSARQLNSLNPERPFSRDVRQEEPEWIFASPELLAGRIAIPRAFQAYLPNMP